MNLYCKKTFVYGSIVALLTVASVFIGLSTSASTSASSYTGFSCVNENVQHSDEYRTTMMLIDRLVPLLQDRGPQLDATVGANQYMQALARISREQLLQKLMRICPRPQTIQDLKDMLSTYTDTLKTVRENNDIFDDTMYSQPNNDLNVLHSHVIDMLGVLPLSDSAMEQTASKGKTTIDIDIQELLMQSSLDQMALGMGPTLSTMNIDMDHVRRKDGMISQLVLSPSLSATLGLPSWETGESKDLIYSLQATIDIIQDMNEQFTYTKISQTQADIQGDHSMVSQRQEEIDMLLQDLQSMGDAYFRVPMDDLTPQLSPIGMDIPEISQLQRLHRMPRMLHVYGQDDDSYMVHFHPAACELFTGVQRQSCYEEILGMIQQEIADENMLWMRYQDGESVLEAYEAEEVVLDLVWNDQAIQALQMFLDPMDPQNIITYDYDSQRQRGEWNMFLDDGGSILSINAIQENQSTMIQGTLDVSMPEAFQIQLDLELGSQDHDDYMSMNVVITTEDGASGNVDVEFYNNEVASQSISLPVEIIDMPMEMLQERGTKLPFVS